MVNDELGKRLKHNYEEVSKTRLTRRMPVAIRIDGKTFHTFTRGFKKPFDEVLGNAMVNTMKYLCENVQNCQFGYTQSDEITLLLIDYQKLTSDAWFDYEVQKMCSIAASMATMAFNKFFQSEKNDFFNNHSFSGEPDFDSPTYKYMKHWDSKENLEIYEAYSAAAEKGAMFDARCFNIPKEEATNLIYWRQLDARRNSIQMVGQAYFSHKELNNKTCNQIQDMLMEKYSINWSYYPTRWKRGVACCRLVDATLRKTWLLDYEMPMLKGEDRKYVDDLIFLPEEEISKPTPEVKVEEPFTPTCPYGFMDCVLDPAYIFYTNPEWYKKLYGDLKLEEHPPCRGCIDGSMFDDEDK